MSREEIIEKLKEAYKIVNGQELMEDFDLNADLRADIGLTSIGMLYFVMVIESLFEIRFSGVGVEDFKSLNDVVDYIGEKLAA